MGSESGTRVQVAGYAPFDATNAVENASAHMCIRRVGDSAALSAALRFAWSRPGITKVRRRVSSNSHGI
jgi:hypothetical protein